MGVSLRVRPTCSKEKKYNEVNGSQDGFNFELLGYHVRHIEQSNVVNIVFRNILL